MNSTMLTSSGKPSGQRVRRVISFVVAVAIVAAINGAVPFVALPSMGSALWNSSFAQSYVNSGWPGIFAHNIGFPHPAPIAFGLSGAFTESVFLAATRLNAADAYSATILLFLALALWGAMRYAGTFGLRYSHALGVALAWGTAPVIWGHAGFAMLSMGIAMLPLYLWSAWLVCQAAAEQRNWWPASACFVAVAILSVFSDGYTFVMFAFGAGIQYLGFIVSRRASRGRLLRIGIPVYAGGFGLSVALFFAFIGGHGYATDPLSVFRGYSVDITMLAFPTKGLLWLWDQLHISLVRNDVYYFGDATVWITTFSAVFGVLGIAGYCLTKNRGRALPLLMTGLLAFYLALGPSFKIHSQRSLQDRTARYYRADMLAQDAVAPTGTAVLWQYVPGFRNMRATYRWSALGIVSFWALFALLVAELVKRDRTNVAWALIVLAVISNLPEYKVRLMTSEVDPIRKAVPLHAPMRIRQQFIEVSQTIVADFRHDVPPGSKVAFFPQSDDFLAGYLAASANVRSFNIGGDKNVTEARAHWPDSVKALFASDPATLAGHVAATLTAGDANVVVVSYVNLMWDAHRWPPPPDELTTARATFAGALQTLAADPRFDVKQSAYYATVTLHR